ncbi:Cna B-type domain-containing protein [Ligilactobacillus salivarius]|uniref:Cna B-type domain-containing protein n=6 Tax=Ligilactobacillus salivarius TaxID=1624 RepID=UPI0013712127|nr:Cna B-type domain-containing protein [Ligilactobacillus salivarius]MYV15325.1 Cna B-type domain-containing protein [Ligilactobacillus salivarius]
MSNKSRYRRLLFMMGLVLFSLLGSIWISSNSGMTVYADSKTNITQNGTGSGTVINQQEEPQISTVNSNTTDNTSSSDDQTSQKQVTNTEAQPRAPTDNNQPVQEDRNYISNSQYSTSNSGANTNQGPSVNSISKNNSSPSAHNKGTSVDITITNQRSSTKEISGGGTTEFSFDFSVPNSVRSGDYTTISLPNELDFTRDQSFNVYAPDGVTTVASAIINKEKKTLVLTYTDYVDKHNDVTGHINMQIMADTEKVKKDTVLPATIKINGNVVTIDSTGISYKVNKGDSNIDFYKYGWMDYDNNELSYRIIINTTNSERNNVIIKDILNSAGVNYEQSSIKIATGTWFKDKNNYWSLANYKEVTEKYTPEFNGSSFSVNLGNINQGFLITYKVKPSHKLINGEQIKNSSSYLYNNHKMNEYTNTVYYQEANGTANGYNYSLTVKKVDESGNPLHGAIFDVIRQSTGEVVGTITTDSSGQGTIYGLLRDSYQLKEVSAPKGYQLADTVIVTSTNFDSKGAVIKIIDKIEKTSVSGTKTWNDNNNQDGIRPSSITVNLLANGQQVASKKVSASDNWQYSFDNLAAYANGQKITYTVTEDAVAGYTSTVNGYNVINCHAPATVKVSGTKTWNDNNNQDGIRPSSITVNLLANGQQVASKKVSASDNWQYSFDNLAAYANGKKITYTVTEDAVAGYTSTVNGYNVTNNHTPATVKVSGTKTWKDNNNQDGIRPSSITVNLLANGQQVASKKVSASDNWQYSFDNLAAYANGKKITYTVTEDAVAGYTSTVNGYNVTNNHTPATVKVSGTKTWKDNNNQDGIRPSSITVNLLANGQQVASKKVSASDNWQYSFDNLAAYANGKKITYTVTEDAVAGYTSTVNGYNVTNNHTPATVKVSGTKTWKDNNNQDGIRPSSITVNLLANGQQVASKKVSASDNWQYSFDNLAAYANGKKITYTVTEDAVAGYTSTVDGYNITNTHNPTTPKKPQVPNNPTTPKKPQVPNNGNKVVPKDFTQGKTYDKTSRLPQTGDRSSIGMMFVGIVMLLLSLGLVVINRFTI